MLHEIIMHIKMWKSTIKYILNNIVYKSYTKYTISIFYVFPIYTTELTLVCNFTLAKTKSIF